MSYLTRSVSELKGVGKTRAMQLSKLGISTVGDLIYYFPRAYEMRGNVRPVIELTADTPSSVILTVGTRVSSARLRSGRTIFKFKAFDDTGAVEVVFFNSPYVKDIFTVGSQFRFYGKFTRMKNQIQLISPKYEPYIDGVPLADYIPVYPLTEGLSSKIIDKLILSVIDEALSNVIDYLPENLRLAHSLPSLTYAIRSAHFPKNSEDLSLALRRLAFDEMLLFGLGIAYQSGRKNNSIGITFAPCSLKPLLDLLPYELTNDQKNAVNDIYKDTVLSPKDSNSPPMSRILVGDVGSGKTVCAIIAMYIAAKSGYQSAMMVPTEILARQHFSDIRKIFDKLGIRVELLLGSTTAKEKKRIYAEVAENKVDVIIGTHSLISDKLEFNSLGLVITDEQHRFGVAQRASLKEKSLPCHMLVMSATPIPRTLALAMYGDLDVSRIVEMPKGRMKVDTFVVDSNYRQRLNDFIKKQVALGGQVYVVCPAIESKDEENDRKIITPISISYPFENAETLPMKNAVEHTNDLRSALPELRIECLHGKMKAGDKDRIMNDFAEAKIDVLVSTTVIEVGVNLPNACVMIIENADRFGLASLHQLRGRVGRGRRKSYCVLVSDSDNEKSRSRLEVMRTTSDGYEIAERDLLLRGPGDFFSLNSNDNFRQSGGFSFKFAKLCDDTNLFETAFSEAKRIILSDPTLSRAENLLLREKLGDLISRTSSTIS